MRPFVCKPQHVKSKWESCSRTGIACAGSPTAAPPPSGRSRRKQWPAKEVPSHCLHPSKTAEDFSNPLQTSCCQSWSRSPTWAALQPPQTRLLVAPHGTAENMSDWRAPHTSLWDWRHGEGGRRWGHKQNVHMRQMEIFPAQPISASRPCTLLGWGYGTGIQTPAETPGWEQSPVAGGAGAQGGKGEGPGWASWHPWQQGARDHAWTERLTRSFCFP